MTDEQLQQWHTTFLTEAQRENYVNHNLEIVRHYRTEAIARAPAFDIERNAISAAIARHGLWMPANSTASASASSSASASTSSSSSGQEDGQPPPQRRARIEQPASMDEVNGGGASAANYGHYVALAHIFSDTYAAQAEPTMAPIAHDGNANSNSSNTNNDREDSNISEIALTETIDSLGLRRT
ncbi:hypothetical protein KR044_003574 [Drosophila immigrans]|nr:hypothetical protein KR044_003574 [Drosophila immigrans]